MKFETIILIATFIIIHFLEVMSVPYVSFYPFFMPVFLVVILSSRFSSLSFVFACVYGVILEIFFDTLGFSGLLPLVLVTLVGFFSYLQLIFGRSLLQRAFLSYVFVLVLTFLSYKSVFWLGWDKLVLLTFIFIISRFVDFLDKTFR